jgi:hypothetical protein
VTISQTWGYDHTISGSEVTYTIPTLHSSDYETMVALVQAPRAAETGQQRLATVNVSYRTSAGGIAHADPVPVEILRVSDVFPVEGVTNAIALRSATTLLYGQTLREVGLRYYEDRNRTGSSTVSADVAESLLALVTESRQVVENTDMRLGGEMFAEEIATLTNYQDILAGELQIAQEERARRLLRYQKRAPVPDRPTDRYVRLLMDEFRLSLASLPSGQVAILGFPTVGEPIPGISPLLADSTWDTVQAARRFELISQRAINALLTDRGVAEADLADVALAVELGRTLEVRFVVTGVTVVSAQTVYIFERVIDTTTGEVVSAAQVTTPR